ncbi:MJ0042 family finger-like protein [Anaeromyxobacter dehalogenans 2CP-1]|uniref:MJ0042 family finger-like protein n=1 Tax=Anaeromyxobacter dehalogenans (strain ATCC BAA-258 / DSM 21875 / 2CP-1) TaxID=455488 RepID=B8JBQ4_ANAD2|nr:tetratricopeptide repeat protein [Anaeromyxobacter dehalogenans]ACL67662.1 MJ0042 family finger-like protein [Anaeromyxobacter dehalogenans 2CP-1]
MDIRCERCRAAYVLEDEQVTAAGVALQCTNCGYLFEVRRKVVFVTTPLRPEHALGARPLAPPPRAGPPAAPAPPAPPAAPATPGARAASPAAAPPAPPDVPRPVVPPTAARIEPPAAFGAGTFDPGSPPSTSLRRSRAPQLILALVLAGGLGLGAKVLLDRMRAQVDLFGGDAASPPTEAEPAAPGPQPGAEPAPPSAVAPEAAPTSPSPAAGSPGEPSPTGAIAPGAPPPTGAPAPAPAEAPGAAPSPDAAPPAAAPEQAGAAARPPAGADALAQAGRLRSRGQIARALELYRGVLAADPDNVAALTGQGLCYLDLARYPSAEAAFQAALRVEPENPDATLGLAETYRWQGNDAEAIRYYERYLAHHPDGEEAAVARNAIDALRR